MPGTTTLKTNLRCEACVAKVKPALEAAGMTDLRFDLNSPDKTVSLRGEAGRAISLLNGLGYSAERLGEPGKTAPPVRPKSFFAVYRPLLLVAVFLLLATALVEIKAGFFDPHRAMNVFMGGFFLFFSFFKFLNLSGFADAFSTYDLIARKSRAYALGYPFVELGLGIAFVLGWFPVVVNLLTALLMLVGSLGVWSVLRKKQVIQCACLGTVFDLPMTKVTLVENTLMFVMALAALLTR